MWFRIARSLFFIACLCYLVFLAGRNVVTEYRNIGNSCYQFDYMDNHYWQQRGGKQLFCANMYETPIGHSQLDPPHNGGSWWAVYVIGSRKDAIFSNRQDAVDWVNAQPLVVDPKQVR